MKETLRVIKFGGTSVGNAERIRRAAEISAATAQRGRTVVVVSAMSGVTNRLIEAARQSAAGDSNAPTDLAGTLSETHIAAVENLVTEATKKAQLTAEVEKIIAETTGLCHDLAAGREMLTPRTLDAISSVGERLSARIVAGALCELGVSSEAVEATELILTDTEYGHADPLMEATKERATTRLRPLLAAGTVPIVTGFIGATQDGVLTTLGRGGSDYSATILGAALDADEVVIWTDVDGVMTADPRLVPEARMLHEISYNEAAELAYFGAKVLHPKTLRPVIEAEIPVWIRNSFAPEKVGTKITPTGRTAGSSGVKAITAISDISLITVGGPGIVGVPGIAAKVFTATATARANVLLISQSSSQNDICFIVHSSDAARTIDALRGTFALDLAHHQVEHITVDAAIAIVAVIGEKMRGTPGIAGRTFNALGSDHINIIAISQGSSEYNVSCVVEAGQMRKAVVAIHKEFNLERRSSDPSVNGIEERAFAKV